MSEKEFKTMEDLNEFLKTLGENATKEPLITIQKTEYGYSLFYWSEESWGK